MTGRRALAPLLLALAAAGCEDSDRGGLGPRGTALPPPDPVPEEAAPPPAARPPAPRTPRAR